MNYRVDIFFVGGFLGLRAVGIYALAVSVAQFIWLISNAAAVVLLPRVASEADDHGGKPLRSAQIARLAFGMSVVMAAALGVGASVLVPFVYGAEFRASVDPLLWLLPGVACFALVNVLAAHIAGIGRPWLNFGVGTIGLIATISLDLYLIPWLGIRGAALASSASYIASTIVIAVIFVKLTGVSIWHLLLPQPDDLTLLRTLVVRVLSAKDVH